MNKTPSHIIQKLKQQPKQGMPGFWDDLVNAGGKGIDAAAAGIEAVGNQANQAVLGIGLLSTSAETLALKFRDAAKQTAMFENESADLAKTFGINIVEAQNLNVALDKIAGSFQGGSKYLRTYVSNLKGLTGGFAANEKFLSGKYGTSLLKTQEILVTNLKLTGDQANKYAAFAASAGNSSTEQIVLQQSIADQIEKSTGLTGVFRDSISDISELSADVQLQYSKMPGNLELAVVKARQLGLKMSDLHKTGKQLLNIESSIGDELEYQLLSGNRLVDQQGNSLTNQYRQAVMSKDANKQADLLNQILKQEGSTLENNLFAREQMSKLLGMDEAAISQALQKQKVLSKIESELGGNIKNLFDKDSAQITAAVNQLDSFKALDDTAKKKYLDEIQGLRTVQTTDEMMLQGIDQMVSLLQTSVYKSYGDKGIKMSEIFQARKESLRTGAENINADIGAGFSSQTAQAATAVLGAGTTTAGALSQIPGLGKLSSLAITPQRANVYATTVTLSTGNANSMEDGVIAPGGGKVLFSGGKASLFGADDYVTASTNNPLTAGGGGNSAALFAAAAQSIVSAIKTQTDALTSNSGLNSAPWS